MVQKRHNDQRDPQPDRVQQQDAVEREQRDPAFQPTDDMVDEGLREEKYQVHDPIRSAKALDKAHESVDVA